MISVTKSPLLYAVSQVIAGGARPSVTALATKSEKIVVLPQQIAKSSYSLSKLIPSGTERISVSLCAPAQVRYAHTDIQVPDFSAYRRDSVKDKRSSSDASADSRRSFTYMIVGGGAVAATYAAKAVVSDFVSTMSASADVLALAKIEIKLDDIPEGKNMTFKWRGKPLFVRHRTAEEIAAEQSVDINTLRHQEADSDRVQKPEWLVLLGVCTHLGDYGGYYCPCHGSHYDASGRIRKGPAPLNMEVPEYTFPEDNILLVG
ncbi:hypothetical protein C0Q70_18698 [Pomacea canaliculata]|uniref:Cytochrome b-c1 complex subunit Rieske, mitochondrial n=1 Tax=Pomacea canaliculata TaxID=400727 RepID=A0A2T7NHC4_POMCA|nr:hypothetical protein C0Q70_18698 [Pomacea canaliculata]